MNYDNTNLIYSEYLFKKDEVEKYPKYVIKRYWKIVKFDLEDCAKKGYLRTMKLICDGGDVESPVPGDVDVTANNSAALRWAAARGHLHIIKFLLQDPSAVSFKKSSRGKRVDVTANYSTSLIWAAEEGHLNIVKFLLQDPSAVNHRGKRVDVTAWNSAALLLSAQKGHLHIIKFLLQDPSAVNHRGKRADITTEHNYALHYAAACGHLPVVKFLLQDPSAVNDRGERCSMMEVDNNIFRGTSSTKISNWTLYFAIRNGHTHIVKFLKDL